MCDGAAFAVYMRADARSRRCGRVPIHVAVRLKQVAGLTALNGDPDRLVLPGASPMQRLYPLPVPRQAFAADRRPQSLLDQLVAAEASAGVRLKAAAVRFLADYHLAASSGHLRSDRPKARAEALARLEHIETVLGEDGAALAEMLVIERMTPAAFQHVTGAGLQTASALLVRLAAAYGLSCQAPDQEAGSAFASA